MALVIGLAGTTLSAEEAVWLKRKTVAGVILFTRNFESRAQLVDLVSAIRAVRKSLIICVDQEGGRVQRFRAEFVALPPLADIGALYRRRPARARRACALHAKLMSIDILASGIDLSFAPVADLARGNLAIGNRAFSDDPRRCAELSTHYAATMQAQGMAATLKHFPGHGSVLPDTHFDLAVDERPASQIFHHDLLPFVTGILAQAKAVMCAHVSYPAICSDAAGYSERWLKHILRAQLGFQGVIFSDDVGMLGGANVGSLAERIERHYRAGCDLILVCSVEATAEVMAEKLGKAAPRALVKSLRASRTGRARRMLGKNKFLAMQSRLAALLEAP